MLPDIRSISTKDLTLLETYINNYELLWVPGPDGSIWFAASQVVQRLGLDPNHTERTVRNAIKQSPMKPRPSIFLLKGDQIRQYKAALLEHHGITLGSNRIYIINWSAVLVLMQKHRPLPLAPLPPVILTYEREEDLQLDLLLLSTYTPHPFTREWTVVDHNKDTPQRTRRFDLVRHTPNNTSIIELKLGILTVEQVASTVGEKGYLQFAKEHFDSFTFTFCAAGIHPAAQRLLDVLPIAFQTHIQLRDQLYDEMFAATPAAGRWHLEERLKQFSSLFPM
jgi:hypothetical protein